jgi:hypothetical protein
MTPFRRSCFAVGLLGALGGCTDPLSDKALPNGTYPLVTVEFSPLPYRGASAITLRGSLVLTSGAGYTLTQTDSALTAAAPVEFRSTGHWSLTDNALVLHDNSGQLIYLGVVVGVDTVRVNFSSRTNTYVRQ